MAQKVTVTLEDDLDGGPAAETVRFGLGGAEYEIDLSKKNATAFRRKLAPYIEHARKAGRGPRRRPGRTRGVMASWRRSSDSLAVRGRLVTKQNRFGISNAASLAWQYCVSSCAVALARGRRMTAALVSSP